MKILSVYRPKPGDAGERRDIKDFRVANDGRTAGTKLLPAIPPIELIGNDGMVAARCGSSRATQSGKPPRGAIGGPPSTELQTAGASSLHQF